MESLARIPKHWQVFFALFILTAIEFWVAGTPVGQGLIVATLVALALAKASLVALYYMHLRYERIVLWLIALSPFVLSAILIVLVASDTTLVP